jgi:hypothetical protein
VNRGIAFAVLLTALVVGLLVGGIAYTAGLNADVVVAAPGTVPTTVVYPGWHGFGFGFIWPFFGILLFFLFVGLVARAFGGWGRGYGGPRGSWGPGNGGWGPGGWDRSSFESGEVPPPFDTALQNWHRRAHGDEPPPATR